MYLRHTDDGGFARVQVSGDDGLQRQHQLDRRLADHTGGLTRAEHAREVLLQDDDDAPQRESEREMDLALTDIETQFPPVFERYYRSAAHRICGACGHLNPAPARFA